MDARNSQESPQIRVDSFQQTAIPVCGKECGLSILQGPSWSPGNIFPFTKVIALKNLLPSSKVVAPSNSLPSPMVVAPSFSLPSKVVSPVIAGPVSSPDFASQVSFNEDASEGLPPVPVPDTS